MEQSDLPAEAGVRFENVVLYRDSTKVFAGLDLELQDRRIGIIGNNGSGKSSLLRLVNGLLMPSEGSVSVCGLNTRQHRKQLPGLAGFLFQNPEHQILFPTGGEEISFGLREAGMDAVQATAKTREILAAHDCVDWEHRPVQELSDGQKQRLCILAVLALEPNILLLDEPFSSLDLPNRRALTQQVLSAPQQVIVASHDLELLTQFDRIIWLERGHVVGDGDPHEILQRYKAAVCEDPALTGSR